ncbi:exocyst subunit SEC5 NDAI_0J00800 [Naumovozyma dairenensis CBS 421]|uniref:Exocyst complex component SEC5 n=1 Tax=Naumovozyma dairenensis (strain ATCC 10597 / BCRC 20456 / CBS 421 / NBRC 0211 / NRRL Y-12639) TaxID=1071378 RepID=G0WGP4_NAUDC|nr:hypothetical protein NDAI_0J00800 [Naumovozyma dairenensis CBS 421]CCD26972.1 hypothetical protein NDAI_0J00800 [Naumovozyma dairenensis CBS 421]
MDPFAIDEDTLKEFYNLKTLNPTTSWEHDSSNLIDLTKWQDISPTTDNSYDILKDLISQQQSSTKREIDRYLNDSSTLLKNTTDPLTTEQMITKLNNSNISLDKSGSDKFLHYLINSKEFNVKEFLRDIHNKDSFDDLTKSLDNLDQLIQFQSNDLKSLVQLNFTKYVKIKNRLDQIYNQFSTTTTQTNDNEDYTEDPVLNIDQLHEKVDESIRSINLKLKPLIDTSQTIKNFKLTKQFIEQNKHFFNLPKILKKCLIKNDYSNLIIEYSKGLKLYNDFLSNDKPLKSINLIWNEVEAIMNSYKDTTWEKLINPNIITIHSSESNFLPLFSKLLDLKIDSNPILDWISIHLTNLQNQLIERLDHEMIKIIDAQKKILKLAAFTNNSDNTTAENDQYLINMKPYLLINQFFEQSNDIVVSTTTSSTTTNAINSFQGLTDRSAIVEMWLLIIKYTIEFQTVCNKFIQLWEYIEKFLDGTYQNILLNDKRKDNILVGDLNIINNYKFILQLDPNEINQIRLKGEEFVTLVMERLSLFFQSSQESLSKQQDQQQQQQQQKPQSNETGLPSDYGFIPPTANGLSCLRYLPKIINPFLKFTTELAQLNITPKSVEISRYSASILIKRCVGAISSIKLRDISNFYRLENWDVYTTITDPLTQTEYEITQFPEIVRCFQEYSLRIIRDFLFSFEKLPVINGISIVGYPSKQLLTGVELQQVISMEAVLESILKNAAKDKDKPRSSHTILTLTNLQYIREITFPTILQYFDDAFEMNLKSKPLEIFNLLNKMETSIFGNYLSELKINLRDILEDKFKEISWPSFESTSFRVGDYILEALMLLVTIYSECFRIGPQLIDKIIKETQIFMARYLFEAFKPFIGNLSSDGLLQVTVDLQFFQKVLGSLLEKDTEATLTACLQNCFQNDTKRMRTCIKEVEPIVNSNLERTRVQFAAFK